MALEENGFWSKQTSQDSPCGRTHHACVLEVLRKDMDLTHCGSLLEEIEETSPDRLTPDISSDSAHDLVIATVIALTI